MSENHQISDLVEHIRSEHVRWVREIGNEDPYTGDVTVGIREVLEAHFLLAEFFAEVGEGIGGIGPKEPKLLISALGRQFTSFGGKVKWQNNIQIVASLMYGLIKNHPFHDANKRTAFLTSILHLQKLAELQPLQIKITKILRSIFQITDWENT